MSESARRSFKNGAVTALGFFSVFLILSSAFAAYSALQTVGTASSWAVISSSEWNKMVSNFASINTQLSALSSFSETDPSVNALGKAALSCSANQIAKWNGSAWACASDSVGGVPVSGVDTVLRSTSSASAATVTGWPTVVANIGSSGTALVTLTASMSNATAGQNCVMMVRATNGANIAYEHDGVAIRATSATANATTQLSGTYLLTWLTPWSTTFTAYHKVSGWTCSLANRHIIVTPY